MATREPFFFDAFVPRRYGAGVFEYHGWATLREPEQLTQSTSYPERAADDLRLTTFNAIQALLQSEELRNELQRVELSFANGLCHLHLSGNRNHRQPRVMEAWSQVAKLAPASYGLLYVHDDEELITDNQWVVWSLRRGTITRASDPFLSPIVPVVDDPGPGW